jgi:GNAT superfamily N-acetyltransferase
MESEVNLPEGVRIRPATAADCAALHALVCELADYERAPDEVHTTPASFERDGFGPRPAFRAFLAESASGEPLGMALFYERFSTWKGRSKYLEDFYVRPSQRGKGIGRALIRAVAAETLQSGCIALQWQVLDWNAPAIGFYEALGTQWSTEWWNGRLAGEALENVGRG